MKLLSSVPALHKTPHLLHRANFAGEEGFGRFLDLHSHYLALINSKFGKRELEYYEYVANLSTHTNNVSRVYKTGSAYR